MYIYTYSTLVTVIMSNFQGRVCSAVHVYSGHLVHTLCDVSCFCFSIFDMLFSTTQFMVVSPRHREPRSSDIELWLRNFIPV
jgi:hypothetical protein